jgi:hypothetical protein
MFQVGDLIEGFEYNEAGDEVKVIGTYVCTTADPEEMIQDIIIKTEDGRTVYIDEQVARPHTPEVKWALAKVMNGFADLTNEKFHTFAVKKNGEIVGQLAWKYRPKNAGGYAWQGKLLKSKKHFGMDVVFYHSSKQKVLEWFKEDRY